jgi:glucokinase
MKEFSIGVDIGGTKCAVLLGKAEFPTDRSDGFILDRINFDTDPKRGPEPIIQEIFASIRRLMNVHGLESRDVVGVGVSCGGPLDHIRGVIMNPPNLYGWNNIPVVERLTDEFGIPAFLQNDANACALAEWKLGAARGCENVIFLTFGTGMGAGLILGGRLYNGANGMAGEVGHIRLSENGPVGYGKAGSFEGFCSGGGIAQIARSKVLEQLQIGISPSLCPDLESLEKLNAKMVAIAAEAGDPLAIDIYRTSGSYLGSGLAILIDIINPDIVVIGSIYERSEALLWPSAEETLRQEAARRSLERCRIVPSGLGDRIGDYAALSLALEGLNAV